MEQELAYSIHILTYYRTSRNSRKKKKLNERYKAFVFCLQIFPSLFFETVSHYYSQGWSPTVQILLSQSPGSGDYKFVLQCLGFFFLYFEYATVMCLLYFTHTWCKIDDLEIKSARKVQPEYFKIRLIFCLKILSLFSSVEQ